MQEVLRILVVDDSALYRQLVRNVLREVPGVEVVGAAKCGREALDLIDQLDPDLLTLDVHMPDIDGIAVLRELKGRRAKAKAIMLSSLTSNGAQVTTDALLEGAFDFIHKPSGPSAAANRDALLGALLDKIQTFRSGQSSSRRRRAATTAVAEPAAARGSPDKEHPLPPPLKFACEAVVVGTSTGGPIALRQVLPALPGDFPVPVLIVQHMPAQYTLSLARRLNEASQLEVVEAAEGMAVEAGFAYIAPGGWQMKVERHAGKSVIRITQDPPENSCRPAVDYLFRSAADAYDGKLLALVMTGMGRDGAAGCREIKRRGGYVMAQHAEGCIVYGMPKVVVDEKLADCVTPLEQIAATVVTRVLRSRERAKG